MYSVEYEINPRCKLTEFVILDFFELFYSEKPILKVNILMIGIIHLTLHTEMTPLRKVCQNKPLVLISYYTVWEPFSLQHLSVFNSLFNILC